MTVNVTTGHVIDGHLRDEVSISTGSKVPVRYVRMTEEQEKLALATKDQMAAMAGTDQALLDSLIADIRTSDLGQELPDGLVDLLESLSPVPENAGLTPEDEVPEPPANPVTLAGDLWLMGDGSNQHRVLCGDSTSEKDVHEVLAGHVPFLMVTDPPYSVMYDPEWRSRVTNLQKTTRQSGTVANDDRADWTPAWQLFPGDVAYIWHAGVHAAEVAVSLLTAEFVIRAQIIWKKQRFVISRGAYHWGHEPCWYSVRDGKTAHWCGDRTQSTVWEVDNLVTTNRADDSQDPENAITGHGTQKPVEIMRRPIVNHTTPGEGVYDPFLGSGSTLIACEKAKRVLFGIDIDPKYVDCAVSRWEKFSGKQATLDSTGQTFAQVRESRLGTTQSEVVSEHAEAGVAA